ncbi:hypothetical protein CBR_g81545 [Chara braunii]|uniref:Uncharacterized protein n=1 Tax=Chara braunii TaxID=69332 RepID=A0A388KAR7_CHABU|nr:hypothetical protein CBR_g81545 [Chara braunii]|eukprot:GBG67121.1 hypothetical protein CBR_g81545 [Chara braunii]
MATSAMSQVSTQSTSSGVSQSGSQVSTSQIASLRVSPQIQLTPEDLEIRQAEELQDELQGQLDEAAERRRKAILRKARLGSRMQELGRLEALDEVALDPVGRVLRNALLSVAEAHNVQQELLAKLVAGQKQILAELRAPRIAGYGQDFDVWAQAQTLEQFVRSVYNRWHDPQGAQKATDAINNLFSLRFKDVRELTDTVEHLLVVPGVRFDQQVLLTDHLRCLPAEVRTKLVDEAYVEQHTFASFSKKALDIEAKLGSAHKVSHDGRKRLPQDWKKKGQLMFVDHDGQTTEIDDFPNLGEGTEQDGASETSDGEVVAPIKEKVRGTGKKKAGRSTGQGDQGTPTWVKLGLDYEDLPRQGGHHEGSLTNGGGLIFEPWECFCEQLTGKHLGPVRVLAALTRAEVVTLPSPLQALAKASDPRIAPQTHSDPPTLCWRDVSDALEELETEWSGKDPRDSWAMISRGPKGEHFVVEVDVGGRKVGAFANIGSTRNFISRACVDRLRLGDRVQRLSRTVASTLANKHQMVVNDYVKDIACTFSYGGGEVIHKIFFLVSDELPFDMLLGMYYLEVSQPQFNWDRKVFTKWLSKTVKDIACTFSYGGGEVIHKISFLVSDELPFDMLLGMYYLEVSQPQFDWDKKVLIHKLPNGRTLGLMSTKQDTGALPRRSARLADRSHSVVPPRTKYHHQRLSRRTTPAASSTATAVLVTTGTLPACPIQRDHEPLSDYLQRVQAFTDVVATAKAQHEAAEAERQWLANEVAAQAQQTAEADAAARERRNVASTESLIQNENQWTMLLQGMIFVPTDAQADPTPAEPERSNLANLMLGMTRAVMWNNKMLQVHLLAERQLRQKQQQDTAALTAVVHAAATQQQQQHQLLNSTLTRVNSIEAQASAAPGCTTDTAKQLGERIDHVVNLIGELGDFTSPATISTMVAAIKTDITKLQSRSDAAPKAYKMPRFNTGKFDDYNKTNALTWWQGFLTEASCLSVPPDDIMKALYLQLTGGAQAWMNHTAANLKCTIAQLHTHILWKEFEQMWFIRFMVRNVVKAAMNEVYTSSQGNMPTRDWTIK